MDAELDGAVEDALVTLDGNAVDIDVHLCGDNLGDFEQQSDAVDARDLNGGIEEELLVHVPLGIEDPFAISRFQLGRYRTVALVDFDAVASVDESQGIITGDGVAA